MALIQQGAESILLEYWLILIGYDLAVDGYLWDKHPEHEAPVPPHPKDALLGHFSTVVKIMENQIVKFSDRPV